MQTSHARRELRQDERPLRVCADAPHAEVGVEHDVRPGDGIASTGRDDFARRAFRGGQLESKRVGGAVARGDPRCVSRGAHFHVKR